MPLDTATQRYSLQSAGYDPDKFTVDEEGNVSPKPTNIQPTITPAKGITPSAPVSNSSVMGAGLRSAAASALPTAAGFAGGVAGGIGTGALMGSSVGPVGTLIGSLIGGLGASYGASKLQSAVLPDSVNQQLATDQAEHPLATGVGGFVPAALTFNPVKGLMNLPNVVKSIPQVLMNGSESIPAGKLNDLVNTVVNVGTATGQNLYDQSQRPDGQPFDWKSLLLQAGGSSLLNEPSGLGKRIGFHSGADIDAGNRARAVMEAQQAQQQQAQAVTPSPDYNTPNPVTGMTNANDVTPFAGAYNPVLPSSGKLATAESRIPSALTKMKGTPEAVDINTLEGEGGNVSGDIKKQQIQDEHDQNLLEQEQKKSDFVKAQNELLDEQIKQAQIQRDLQAEQNAAPKGVSQNTLKITQDKMLPNEVAAKPESIPAQESSEVLAAQERQRISNEQVAKESAEDLANRKLEGNNRDKYQSESQLDQATWDNLPENYKAKVHEIAAKRGITLKEAYQVIDPDTGNAKLGSYQGDTRTATVSSTTGRGDTVPHEVQGHGYLNDLLTSNIPSDKALGQRALDIHGGDKVKAEESLALRLGLEGHNRIKTELEGTTGDKMGQWTKDFLSRMKVKLGMGSDEDVIRHISQRSVTDAPRGMRGEIGGDTKLKPYFKESSVKDYLGNINPLGTLEGKAENIKSSNDQAEYNRWIDKNSSIEQKKDSGNFYVRFRDASGTNTYSIKKTYAEALKILNEERNFRYKSIDIDSANKGQAARLTELKSKDASNLTPAELEERNALQTKSDGLKGKWKFQEESALPSGDTPSTVNLNSHKEELSKSREPNKLEHATFPLTRSLLDTIDLRNGSDAKPLTDAARKYYPERNQIKGKYMEPIYEASKDVTPEDDKAVNYVLIAERRAGKSYRDELINDSQKNLYDAIRKSYVDKQTEQISKGQLISDIDKKGNEIKRDAKIDPFYHINPPNPKVMQQIRDNPSSSTTDNYRKDFIQHNIQQGLTEKQAQAHWDNLTLSNSPASVLKLKEGGSANYFKADRIAQGVGLPDSMMRNEPLVRQMDKYYGRVGSDRAFFDNIENNPKVAKSIGLLNDQNGKPWEGVNDTKPIGGEDVRALLENMRGEHHDVDSSIVKEANKVATGLILGPMTNAHIAISSLANTMNYLRHPGEAVQSIKHALSNLAESRTATIRNGYDSPDRYSVKDIFNNDNTFAERLSAATQTLSNISGRGVINHTIKPMLQGMSHWIVNERIMQGMHGDVNAQKFLKQLDPEYSPEKVYNSDDVSKMGSQLAGLIHGDHTANTMPRWMLRDSAVQPFFQLASWNIAQTNNFMKHVVTPARNGNITPLIMSTLGAGLGGMVLKKIRETMSDTKAPFPGFGDLAASSKGVEGNIPLVAYNLMSMSSMAGYGGVLSLLGKTGFDVAYKNMPQAANFPLDEVFSSSLNTLTHVASAIAAADSPEEYLNIGGKAVVDLARENIQMGRLATTWVSKLSPDTMPELAQQRNVSAAKRDYRNYQIAEGQKVEAQNPSTANPYLDLQEKKFKRTGDMEEAVQELPQLIEHAFKEANGNPELLKKEFEKIKSNNYETLPNPDNMPMQFIRYMQYLRNTQGEEAAQERFMDYLKHNTINKAKSSLVPSF